MDREVVYGQSQRPIWWRRSSPPCCYDCRSHHLSEAFGLGHPVPL